MSKLTNAIAGGCEREEITVHASAIAIKGCKIRLTMGASMRG
jgi:hypothetical protein